MNLNHLTIYIRCPFCGAASLIERSPSFIYIKWAVRKNHEIATHANFGIMTKWTLIELSDSQNETLDDLIEKAHDLPESEIRDILIVEGTNHTDNKNTTHNDNE
ncbi:MAG: hypothetical protein EZS28_004703 [Streblomastix strix]|uniref:Uncharacterized protein n=1 Tax=Streblomastix strix TaxID=222440 RepID=A0A5J4WY68_9EUKA|nr:MAG: hypothetical protein EZS28_004703 [Streblomastix strix]